MDGAITAAAEARICPLGRGDHGHTDCWIFSSLLDEVEELEAKCAALRDTVNRLEVGLP